jgi:hypothetical protein
MYRWSACGAIRQSRHPKGQVSLDEPEGVSTATTPARRLAGSLSLEVVSSAAETVPFAAPVVEAAPPVRSGEQLVVAITGLVTVLDPSDITLIE